MKKKNFDAFISYSHKDKAYATIIQQSLEKLGLPFYRAWKPDVTIFRDERKMPLANSLTTQIREGLKNSSYLIVLASKHSAASTWVKAEVMEWWELNHDEQGYITNFNFILIDDTIAWDTLQEDFDRLKTTALPDFGRKLFRALPLWANLQPYCRNQKIKTGNANYEWEIAKIKALLLKKAPDAIIDEVSKGKRVFGLVIGVIMLALALLTVFAFYEKQSALAQRDRAQARELLLNAEKNIKSDPELSLSLLSIAAEKQMKSEGKLSADMRGGLERLLWVNSFRVPFEWKGNSTIGTGGIESFALSPDGDKLAIGSQDSVIRVLSTRDYHTLYNLKQNWTNALSFSSDGKYLASSGQSDTVINIWNAATGQNIKSLSNKGSGMSVSWRENTHQLAFATAWGPDSKVRVYDLDKNRVLYDVSGIRGAWSPDGSILAAGGFGDKESLSLYHPDGRVICENAGHTRYVHNINWKPGGRYVATSSVDDQVIIWDTKTCAKVKIIKQGFPLCAVWSPDGRQLAVGGGNGVINVYRADQQFKLQDSLSHATTIAGDKVDLGAISGYVLDMVWSKDGKYLLVGDREKSITYIDARLFGEKSDEVLLQVAQSAKRRPLTEAEKQKYLLADR